MSTKTNAVIPKKGMSVQKDFNGELYWGTITAIDEDDKRKKLYHIKYDDGDEEDLYHDDCVDVLKERPHSDVLIVPMHSLSPYMLGS